MENDVPKFAKPSPGYFENVNVMANTQIESYGENK